MLPSKVSWAILFSWNFPPKQEIRRRWDPVKSFSLHEDQVRHVVKKGVLSLSDIWILHLLIKMLDESFGCFCFTKIRLYTGSLLCCVLTGFKPSWEAKAVPRKWGRGGARKSSDVGVGFYGAGCQFRHEQGSSFKGGGCSLQTGLEVANKDIPCWAQRAFIAEQTTTCRGITSLLSAN